MRTHVKVVGLINLVYSALGLLSAAGVLFGGVFGSLASFNPFVMVVGTVVSSVVAVIIAVLSGAALLASLSLLNHQQWARYTIIVLSTFRLFNWWFGTLVGGYSLWVLLHRETRELFATQHQG